MSSFRLIFVACLVVIAVCYCRCQLIPDSEIEFDLVVNQPNSFKESIADSLKPRETVFASKTVTKIVKNVAAAMQNVPELAPFASVLPAIQLILRESDNWSKHFAQTVPRGVQNSIRVNEIDKIMSKIRTLDAVMSYLAQGTDLTQEVQISYVYTINTELDLIISTFSNGDSPYRAYPTFAVPVLFTLASFAADFQPILERIAPSILSSLDIFCRLAETIADYFPLTLLNRLNEIAIEAEVDKTQKPQRAEIEAREFKKPFNPNTMHQHNSVRCVKIGKNDAAPNDRTGLVLRDKLNKMNSYLDKIGGNCINDYFLLVRNRLETTFGDAFKLVDRICPGDVRTKRAQKQPTGNFNSIFYYFYEFLLVYRSKLFQFHV